MPFSINSGRSLVLVTILYISISPLSELNTDFIVWLVCFTHFSIMDVEEHLHFEDKVDDMEVQDFQPLPRERSNTWHGDFVYLDSRPHEFSAISEKVMRFLI